MNPSDLADSISACTFSLDRLKMSLTASGPVAALVLMPLVRNAAEILNTLEQLKSALKASK